MQDALVTIRQIADTPTTEEERFLRHLRRASAMVAMWPEWKRNILGVVHAEVSGLAKSQETT